MYIKKSVLVLCAIILVTATVVLTLGVVNPFGFDSIAEFIQFSYVTRLLNQQYYQELEPEQLMNGAISGMAAATGDPYTGYLWGDKAKEYLEEIDGAYCGVGLYIENNTEDNTIQVVSAIAGGPAAEAGITTGDKILKIDGKEYTGEEINSATSAMRGEAGAEVTLTILQAMNGETKDVTLTRQEIKIENVTGTMVTETVGRINITQFSEGAAERFRETYEKLKKEGMTELVIDLRNNPGGLLDETVEIASLFVEEDKVIVYTEDRYGNRENYLSEGATEEIPIVLLTNPGSASASEVLTGALKDYGVGYQIGEKTYGKGVVQGVFQTGESEVLSVTVSQYFTPKGECIHEKGIKPDQEIPMDIEKYQRLSQLSVEEDEQLQAALEYLSK